MQSEKPPLTIWTNVDLPGPLADRLRTALVGHRILHASATTANNLAGAPVDPNLEHADVAFGQPEPGQIMQLPRLRWVQLTTAGYTRYDSKQFRDTVRRHGTAICNASSVYAEPCAQHVLAMMLALARKLPQSLDNQRGPHGWPYLPLRAESKLLNGQTVLLIGYGAIARRLAELLAPFRMTVIGFRRSVAAGDASEAARILPIDQLDAYLPAADHVVNVLPASSQTRDFFTAARFARLNRDACYYNIGRGSTNDEAALKSALDAGTFAAAYIDAFAEEPLPADHPLWTTLNCYITPHTAGGHTTEYERHVEEFLENLRRFQSGEPLIDRVL